MRTEILWAVLITVLICVSGGSAQTPSNQIELHLRDDGGFREGDIVIVELIGDIESAVGLQFRLVYDSSGLEILKLQQGTTDEVFRPTGLLSSTSSYVAASVVEIDDSKSEIFVAISLLSVREGETVSGRGRLGEIAFKVKQASHLSPILLAQAEVIGWLNKEAVGLPTAIRSNQVTISLEGSAVTPLVPEDPAKGHLSPGSNPEPLDSLASDASTPLILLGLGMIIVAIFGLVLILVYLRPTGSHRI